MSFISPIPLHQHNGCTWIDSSPSSNIMSSLSTPLHLQEFTSKPGLMNCPTSQNKSQLCFSWSSQSPFEEYFCKPGSPLSYYLPRILTDSELAI